MAVRISGARRAGRAFRPGKDHVESTGGSIASDSQDERLNKVVVVWTASSQFTPRSEVARCWVVAVGDEQSENQKEMLLVVRPRYFPGRDAPRVLVSSIASILGIAHLA